MDEFAWLTALAVLFVGQHLGVTSTGLRVRLAEVLGERAYVATYSVVSIVIFVLLIRAYNATTPELLLWPTSDVLRLVPLVFVPLALLLVVGGLVARNPTALGVVLESGSEAPVEGVLKITRHPVQCGILIWSLTHMLANGDLPSLVFFGALALVSGVGMVLIDRRKQQVFGAGWAAFRGATSLTPFAAIVAGRQSFKLSDLGWLAPLLAAVVFLALWWGHVWVSGVPVGLVW